MVTYLTGCAGTESPAAPGPRAIVVRGRPSATILLQEGCAPRETQAANELRDYVAQATGAVLPIANDSRNTKGYVIRILTHIPVERESREGFSLTVTDQRAEIDGASPVGALYGVYELLERGLGVRWYLPGPLGEVVPKRATLALPEMTVTASPSFEMRWVGLAYPAGFEVETAKWALRNRQNVHRANPPQTHALDHWLPVQKYFRSHPQYYALVDGRRQELGSRIKLCYSNPQVLREVAQNICAALDADPERDMIQVSPMDEGNWCQCPDCRRMDEPEAPRDGSMSRRNVLFFNAVAAEVRKSHPEAKLALLAYDWYLLPPHDPSLRLDPMIYVMVTRYRPACGVHAVPDPSCPPNQEYVKIIKAWETVSDHVCIFEYYWWPCWLPTLPIVHSVKADIPWYRSQKLAGLCTLYTDNAWSNFPVYYVAARLLWDAGADADAIISQMLDDLFGAAAPHMEAYYDLMEREMARCPTHLNVTYNPYAAGPAVFTPEVVAELRRHYDLAVAANTDPTVALRLKKVGASLEHAEWLLKYQAVRPLAMADNADLAQAVTLTESAFDLLDRHLSDIRRNPEKWSGTLWWPDGIMLNERTALLSRLRRLREEIDAKTGRVPQPLKVEPVATTIPAPPLAGWTLQFSDDFERADLGPDWTPLRGAWTIEDGWLVVPGDAEILCARKFPGCQRLEFDARTNEPCDLNGVICANELGYVTGYFVGFGTQHNAFSNLIIQGVEVKRWDAVITPGKVHHQIVQREGDTIIHVVDGKVVMTYQDAKPLKGDDHDRIGFYLYGPGQFDNVRVYTKPEGDCNEN